MNTSKLGTALVGALLVVGVVSSGCVADRPSRNGVFNENQYLRKDFLILNTDANGTNPGSDPGWMVRATVTETSTPNVLAGSDAIDVWAGLESEVNLVRFRVTQDKLQMLNQIQLSEPVSPNPTTGAPNGPSNETGVTEQIVNAWPVTNVDLKYQVNLDGEETNFYQENQELDWQVRQWVKLQFDKNDFSDLAPLPLQSVEMINECADIADASATLVTGSFNVQNSNGANTASDYFEFTVQVAIPMNFNDQTCLTAYGAMAAEALNVGHTTVTVNLKYSFVRATATADLTYKPFAIAEKDPIRTKYGPIQSTVWNRDNTTGLIAATQFVNRFDPQKPIVWYFDQNFPAYYKPVFVGGTPPGAPAGTPSNPGIQTATNKLLADTGVPARVTFLNYNDATTYGDGQGPSRNFGDIRYNFLRWVSDQDSENTYSGVTMPGVDPRDGEVVNDGIQFNDQALRDTLVQRIDAFLQTVGASAGIGNTWPTGSCTNGATQPIVSATTISNHNAQSTLFSKMQQYLGLHGPDPSNDHLGPQDFTAAASEDQDFLNAYFQLIPYEVFADPDMNQFVTREGGQGVYGPAAVDGALQQETTFEQLTGAMNAGTLPDPYSAAGEGTAGVLAAAQFANNMKDATTGHQQLQLMKQVIFPNVKLDPPGAFSLETVMEQDSQQCVNGQWESQAAWIQHIIDSYWQQVFWHEFGHGMGMDHNFMGNVDQPNFTTQRTSSGAPVTDANGNTLYNMYSSTVMDYLPSPAGAGWQQGWGNYDKGTIFWLYANNGREADNASLDAKAAASTSRAGEIPGSAPGKEYPYYDKYGFCLAGDPDCTAGIERQYLRCDATHLRYSPICRWNDVGTTPSQIIANDIDMYEWQYQWRNFRDYRKVWDEADYANQVSSFIVDTRRFLSQWEFDWQPGDIAAVLYRVGVTPPAGAVSAVDYYQQLTQKFLVEMSKANQMVAAFHEAIIQQSAGERPYATVYDKFYGDVVQQGIILDKYFAMQEFVGLWVSDNYDQNQAGAYISSWGEFNFDSSYTSVAETAVTSMIGSQYAVYPYFIPTAVALFAQDTHNPAFLANGQMGVGQPGERVEAKDWIGGWTFSDYTFMVNFFRQIAVTAGSCTTVGTCTYDPTDPTQVSQDPQTGAFIGPDGLSYVIAYIQSRNEYVVARADRNIATYKLISSFNTDINATKDDGTDGAYSLYEYPIKYTIDSYETYEQGTEAGGD
jgi:hypothetical protein